MEQTRLPPAKAILLLGAVAFAWGTAWPVTKALLEYLPPLWATAIRSAVGTAALFATAMAGQRMMAPPRGDVPVVLNIALLHMLAFSGLVALGLQFVTAGRSVVLAYTMPLWVAVGARIFLGEPLTPRRLIGIALGLCGLLLLLNPAALDWSDRNALVGNALVLLAALCWAASILHVRAHKWVTTPLALVPWQALLATCLLFPFALMFEGVPSITWSGRLVALLLYGGVIGIAVPYWATQTVNRSLPAITTSLGLLAVPVVGVVCSSLALGEAASFALLAAMGLIIAGIAIGTTGPASGRKT